MGNTSRYGWAYPETVDPPNTALHLKNALTAVETTVGGLDDTAGAASRPRGYVGGASGNADTTVTTTEAVLLSATFTTVAGRRYKFTADAEYYQKTGTPGTNMIQNVRVIAGATPTANAGTLVRAKHPNTGSSLFVTLPTTLIGTWVAPTSGTYAASFTVKSDAGTGGIAGGADHTYELMIEDVTG
ncbi:hypothetical protein [Amycolatopsis sp. NPDC051371]|uniref:hypothetical protein n=1 Tax=Amycolatopsis sp. NPDC051371 TaxID=3155800 RepID=UPI0034246E51